MLISKRFYFFKAWYDWITDNHLTPYVIVDAQLPNVQVPKEYVQDGRITLNISQDATDQLKITRQTVSFESEFDEPINIVWISIPINAILAIYAFENRQGGFFMEEELGDEESITLTRSNQSKKPPEFTIVE